MDHSPEQTSTTTARARWSGALSLTGVLTLALAARIWSFTGISGGWRYDDSRYLLVAENLANGHLPVEPGAWFATRIVFLWPVATLIRLFGTSDYIAVAWPLAGSLASVFAAYLLGRDLGRRRAVGLIAASLVALAPLELRQATQLRPDSIWAALLALSVWCALRTRAGDRAWFWAACCGFCLGAAWGVRESAVWIVPVLIVAARWPGWRAVTAFAVGASSIPGLALSMFALLGLGRNPLVQTLNTGVGVAGAAGTDGGSGTGIDTLGYARLIGDAATDMRGLLALTLPVIGVSLVALAARRSSWPAAFLPACWLGLGYLYLEFGTLDQIAKVPRYMTILSIPAALCVALALAPLLRRRCWPAALAPIALTGVIAALTLSPLAGQEARADDVVALNRAVSTLQERGAGAVLSLDYTWWWKANTYLARQRLAVPDPSPDISVMSEEQRLAHRRLDPLPCPALYAGGWVITRTPRPRSGWPSNWSDFQQLARQQVPWDQLVYEGSAGGANLYRWPAGVPARGPACLERG